MTNLEKLNNLSKEEVYNFLYETVSRWAGIYDDDSSYIHDLTRVKSAYSYGTMSFEDFVEWDEDRVSEVVNELIEWLYSQGKHLA